MRKIDCNVHKIVFGPNPQTYSIQEAENWLAFHEKGFFSICHNCCHVMRKKIGQATLRDKIDALRIGNSMPNIRPGQNDSIVASRNRKAR